MSLAARRVPESADRPTIAVRRRSVALLFALTAFLIAVAAALPPIVPTRANLADAHQALFARAIWPESQVSLAVLMIFLPALLYAVTVRGLIWGRLLIGSLSLLGTAVATYYVILSLNSYIAGPISTMGMVTDVDRNRICVHSGPGSLLYGTEPQKLCYTLAVPTDELLGAPEWVRDRRSVQMLVSSRGHVGYIEPIVGALQG